MLAIDRLASEQPFHASILSRWKLVQDSSVSTMGVGFQGGRLILYFSPEFVERITLDELVGVVQHECNHVLLGHIFHDAPPHENRRARVVAEECSANEWVSHSLPCNPILLSHYPDLPENEDTETRYDRLAALLPDTKTTTLDDHNKWSEILSNGQLSKAVVTVVLAQAWGSLTPEQKAKVALPPSIQKAVEEAVKTSGSSVIGTGSSSVAWQQVLRRYVGRSLSRRLVFTRPPRRFPAMTGIIAGRGRSQSKPKIMAVIDTSGSMSSKTLADISAELAVMSRTHEVLVVECDREIHSVYPYRPIHNVQGRGGTDFRPPLASDFQRQHRPDLVVYFTDGYGKAPCEPPRVPVIWCLTMRGKQPCGWGKMVRIQ